MKYTESNIINQIMLDLSMDSSMVAKGKGWY